MANFDYMIRLRGVDNISKVLNKINDKLEKAKNQASKFSQQIKSQNLKAFRGEIEQMNAKLKASSDGLFNTAASFAALGLTIAKPVQAAIEFEETFADIKKVVSATEDQFASMKQEIFDLSKTIPLLPTELNKIVASGGRLGIPREQLAEFTKTVAKASVAFDMTAEQAGTAFASIANKMSIPITRVGELGDAINHLSDTTATTAPAVIEIMGRISGTMSQLKIPPHLSAGLSAFADQVFVTQELAASGLNQMISAFARTNKQFGLYDMIQKKGIKGIQEFLKQASKMNQVDLVKMFGVESGRAIAQMATKVKLLDKTLGQVANTTKFAGSMQKEFETRSKTTANQLALLRGAVNRVMITIGDALLPVINQLIQRVSPLIERFSAWAKKNQKLIKIIIVGAAALAILTAAVLALKLVVLPIAYALTLFKIGVVAVGVAFKALTIIMMANPFVLLGVAIAAAIHYFIGFDNVIQGVKDGISFLWEKVKGFFQYLKSGLSIVDTISSSLSSVVGSISSALGFSSDNVKAEITQKAILEKYSQPIDISNTSRSDVNVNLEAKNMNISNVSSKTYGSSLNVGVNSLGGNR